MRLQHPYYGSILWGVRFEGLGRDEQEQRLADCLAGLSVAVFSEAQTAVYPDLFTKARQLAPSAEVLMHRNAMSVWAKESTYWPVQNELRRWADQDPPNRYLWRGDRIAEGWPGTRLLNVTRAAFLGYRGAWASACDGPPEGCAGYFLDEAHDTRGWMSPEASWPSAALLQEAIKVQIRTATMCGGSPAWINGTAGPTGANPRRYIQNAGACDPGYLLNQMIASCWNQPESNRRILIQVDPVYNNFDFWIALAAIGDAGVEFSGAPWDAPPVRTDHLVTPHSWGHGELDEYGGPALMWSESRRHVGRMFDKVTVMVDLAARTATVEER